MRRVWCGALLSIALTSAFQPVSAAAEDRQAFCRVVADFAREHANDRGKGLTRAIGDQFAELARYAKSSIADDFRLVARFYRLRAHLGSEAKALKALGLSRPEIMAVKGRVGRYEISLCLPEAPKPST